MNTEDAAGRIRTWSVGNGLAAAQNFNDYTGRLADGTVSSGANVLLQEGYQYDGLGNVLQRFQQWGGVSFTENFDYDQLNRLSHATIVGYPQQAFTYDDIGNVLTKTGVGSGSYAYPASGASSTRPHAVASIPGFGSFVYDNDGNLLSGAGRSVTWNSFDMPVTITKGGASSTFYYGPDHQRVKQVRSDGVTVWYAGPMEVEASAGAATVKTYLPNAIDVEIDNLERRAAEHARDPNFRDYTYEVQHRTDVRSEQRGLEQMLHDQYAPPLNKINPISPTNPRYNEYMDAARRFLGR